jgi:starch synthase (maltosyl-transferring)
MAEPACEFTAAALVRDGRARAVIDAVRPAVDMGRFPIKRIAGEAVEVEAHCFTDGHDRLRVVLRWLALEPRVEEVREVEMTAQPNDLWIGAFSPPRPGRYRYTVMAWVDHFESWRAEFERRTAEDDIRMALSVGAALVDAVAARADSGDSRVLRDWSTLLRAGADAPPGGADLESLRATVCHSRALCRPQPRLDVAAARSGRRPGSGRIQQLV